MPPSRQAPAERGVSSETQSREPTRAGTGGGGGAVGNFDGGQPDSNYGGISSIDAGGVTA